MTIENNKVEAPKTEFDIKQITEQIKNIEFGNEAQIEGAKDSLNIVKNYLKDNFKTIDGTNQGEKKLNSYIDANKIFQKYIKDNIANLNWDLPTKQKVEELATITEDIQKLIDEKTIDTIKEINKEANKTKKEMMKNFEKINGYKEVFYDPYNKKIEGVNITDQSEEIKNAHTETKATIDDILKITELKKIRNISDISDIDGEIVDIKNDRLLELQTYLKLKTSDFPEKEIAIIDARIEALLPKASKSAKQTDAENEINRAKNNAQIKLGGEILNIPQTPEYANKLFETGPEKEFNAVCEKLHAESTEKGNPRLTTNENFKALITEYWKPDYDTVKEIKIGKATRDWMPTYQDGTRIIDFEVGKTEKKEKTTLALPKEGATDISLDNKEGVITATQSGITYTYDSKTNKFTNIGVDNISTELNISKYNEDFTIENNKIYTNEVKYKNKQTLRGTQDHLQTLKSKQAISESKGVYSLDDADKITPKWETKTINKFDGIGNYRTFEKYLKAKGSDFVGANINTILTDIKSYERTGDDIDEDLNGLKNGYATVLTNYMVSSDASDTLLQKYLEYLTPTDMAYLGVDKATQVANFNTLVKSNKFKSIESKLPQNIKDNMLALKFAIEKIDQKSFQDQLKSGFKEILNSFGGVLLDIIELFGGKGALRKFCAKFGIDYDKYFEDLEKLYDDTYELNKDQKDLLQTAYDEGKNRDKNPDSTMSYYENNNKKEIPYSQSQIVTYYTNIFSEKTKFELLDPTLVELAMKEKKVGNSNVIISEKGSNGKIEKKINKENNLTNEEIKVIVEYIIKGDEVDGKGKKEIWDQVKKAGEAITQTDSVYNTKQEEKENNKMEAERLKAEDSKIEKGFNSAADIGVYFGAYLMKGSKDLKYTISQTDDLPFEATHKQERINQTNVANENAEENDAKETFRKESKVVGEKIRGDINDTGAYGNLDTYTFDITDTTDEAIKYKTDILDPLKNLFVGGTKVGTTEYKNYNFLSEQLSKNQGKKEDNEKLMTSIKNMLKIEKNPDYEKTIEAIKKGNTYTTSVDNNNNIIFDVKDSEGKTAIGKIILGVTDKKITTKREATVAKE